MWPWRSDWQVGGWTGPLPHHWAVPAERNKLIFIHLMNDGKWFKLTLSGDIYANICTLIMLICQQGHMED